MGVKVATGCLNWSQPSISHSSSSSSSSPQTLASAISSPSSKRRSLTDVPLVCRYVHRSTVFGKKLNRSRSCGTLKLSNGKQSIKRVVSANLDSEFSDEEFSREIQELALRFQFSDDDETDSSENHDVSDSEPEIPDPFISSKMEPPPEWPGDMIPASIERKANSMELPFSLRIIQKKKQWEEGFMEAGESLSSYCSMKKAFSSMVFIIRELQSYTLQMREVLFFEDLQGILVRVQKEMNASFVWLFQQVFSHTPTLMVYVMILLANYSVYSMSNNIAIAAPPPPPPATMESVSAIEDQTDTKFDSLKTQSFSVNSGGKTTSIGGINGGGGKSRPLTSGTDGDGKFDESIEHHRTVDPSRTSEESVSGQSYQVEEWALWHWMVAEADKMMEPIGYRGLDHETMQRFVSPVTAKLAGEVDTEDYSKTELLYEMGLSEEPTNPLLLANYAQAESYFKRALEIEPKDAESLSKYAGFLWHAKQDLWAAEETYLEAISADPDNSFYSASYAHFLWTNGADDTCYPLD
ncbi:hypothetical protein Ccrd_018034 [Cynara cardunculus var. scolymus]|uniref:Uncharacterized protein n=1 Tax=Cynara cardunculus var. scolymus TaxID=59895 RepID=A0A103Y6Y6_CYNCS|nr:hypothetical protein Ccrd_018034 [Cynara cardunculus var. scolymus]